jgi:hypothetical protein
VKTRTVTEYRLIITRAGNQVKDWRARSLKAVARRIGLLTHPEPWRFYADEYARAKGPDDYFCCAGTYHDQCGCGGTTMREETEAKRRDLPLIESIKMQTRRITYTAWESADAPVPVAMIPCEMCGNDHAKPEDCEFYEVTSAEPHT